MPLYEITDNSFRPLSQVSFVAIKVREREDLQRLLRSQIEVLGDDLYLLTEEFGGRTVGAGLTFLPLTNRPTLSSLS